MVKVLVIVAAGVCVAAIASSILALVVPYWMDISFEGYAIHAGLFKFCNPNCANIVDATSDKEILDSIKACQAMVLLGCIAMVGALVSFILQLCVMKNRKICGYLAAGLAAVGGLCLMIAMAVYAKKIKYSTWDYSAGFVFDILGWLAGWLAAVLMLLKRQRRSSLQSCIPV